MDNEEPQFDPTYVANTLLQLARNVPHYESESVGFVEETMMHLGFETLDNDARVYGCTASSVIDLLNIYGAYGHVMKHRVLSMDYFDEAEALLEQKLAVLREGRREWINRNNLNK